MAKEKAPVASAAPAEDRKRAIEAAMGQIEKMYGKGSIMRLGDQNNLQVDVIPTGSLSLDVALGVGGLPRGRIVEIYGPESSGKTTLALHVAAEAQKKGGEVAFVDAEHALDPTYAKALGVNVEDMLISQPDTGEQALEITEALVRSGAIDVVVVDSVAALVPRAEIEGEMGDSFVGLHARLMSQALRKLTGIINKTNSIVIFINQLREKVGVMYGNPEVTTGGRALKFYASVRIDVRRIEALEEARGESVSAVYLSGGLKVEFNSRRVTVDGAEVHLTKNEFKILALLCRYSGRVVTGNHIIKTVWGAGIADGSGILRVNIANLRKKIERDSSSPIYLFTESGVGYRMAESEAELTS